ncbi:MAG: replication-associated recombination protein A [Vicinamibacterales bacterium]|nr:replication-associated recombination protein A [Vicinamibacterales bacterium]
MTSLFDEPERPLDPRTLPLPERMRPRTLDEIVGQEALLGRGRPLREAIERDLLQSIILWGPPGTGKTTLARIIADVTRARFIAFSAVLSGIKEIREVMAEAEAERRRHGRRTIVFIDEIHRFNKAQQDAFLPRVEAGDIVLIGATTENPSFEVNAALLSRSKVFVLQPLDEAALVRILEQAVADEERGLGRQAPEVTPEALAAMARLSSGDARSALNLLHLAVSSAPQATGPARVDLPLLESMMQRRMLLYDKGGEQHFNIISALHKSMRNSDPDASVYWLARMVEAGEDPLYIARRLVRFASEDVGNADPQALTVAVAAKEAVHFLGMPEGNTALAQAALYLATAPKSHAVYAAYTAAAEAAGRDVAEPVPLHLRNAPTRLMQQLDYGKGYQYAHDDAEAVTDMDCLPERLRGRQFYTPPERGFEKEIKRRLDGWNAIKRERRAQAPRREE